MALVGANTMGAGWRGPGIIMDHHDAGRCQHTPLLVRLRIAVELRHLGPISTLYPHYIHSHARSPVPGRRGAMACGHERSYSPPSALGELAATLAHSCPSPLRRAKGEEHCSSERRRLQLHEHRGMGSGERG